MIKTAIVLCSFLLFGFAIIYFVNPGNIFADFEISSSIISPLKPFGYSNSYVNTQIWKPNLSANFNNIEINGKAGLVYNLTDEKIVFIKNPEYKGSIASMVKVMTAMVSIDNISADKPIKISKQASQVEEDSMEIL